MLVYKKRASDTPNSLCADFVNAIDFYLLPESEAVECYDTPLAKRMTV